MTTRTLFKNFEGVSQILKEQSGIKRYLGVFSVHTSNSNNLQIWKPPYLTKKSGVLVVVDYADTGFSIFAIEYLRENENVCKTVFACSYGAKAESFKPKNSQKYRDTVPLIDHHTS